MKLQLRPLLSAVCSTPGGPSHLQPWLLPLFRDASVRRRFQSHSSAQKSSEPLRILFCGSDDFSCANLKALHDEQIRNPGLIESIDVVVRPGKRVGRGYKKIQHPPLRALATELNIPIHERDTFTGWTMPSKINLIIAVSFGLFVPRRLLRGAQYGGLNVHPSLLPEFRGAAPLHHTLLAEREITGVTLQTLDDKTFDAGVILAQTPLDDAFRIPEEFAAPELQAALTPLATEILVQSLREGRHVPPYRAVGWEADIETGSQGSGVGTGAASKLLLPDANAAAPKITPRMRQLIPSKTSTARSWSAKETLRRQRIIGPLWFMARDREGKVKRAIIEGDLRLADRKQLTPDEPGVFKRFDIYHYDTSADAGGKKESGEEQQLIPTPAVFWTGADGEKVYLVESIKGDDASDSAAAQEKSKDSLQPRLGDFIISALEISQLKVEGEKAKPASVAFAHFASELVNPDQLMGEYHLGC